MGELFPAQGDADAGAGRDGLDLEEYWADRVVVVAAAGTVDTLTAPQLTEAIGVAAAQSPAAVIIDLSKVDFLASAGMSVLVAANEQVTPHARFGVVADGPVTRRPMTLVGLDSVITLYRTLDDALHDIGGA
jgi:anti-sigma B factor antagonist